MKSCFKKMLISFFIAIIILFSSFIFGLINGRFGENCIWKIVILLNSIAYVLWMKFVFLLNITNRYYEWIIYSFLTYVYYFSVVQIIMKVNRKKLYLFSFVIIIIHILCYLYAINVIKSINEAIMNALNKYSLSILVE